MNAGEAITAGMRAQRAADLRRGMWGGWGHQHAHRLQAWCWWGWSISGVGGLGRPGL